MPKTDQLLVYPTVPPSRIVPRSRTTRARTAPAIGGRPATGPVDPWVSRAPSDQLTMPTQTPPRTHDPTRQNTPRQHPETAPPTSNRSLRSNSGRLIRRRSAITSCRIRQSTGEDASSFDTAGVQLPPACPDGLSSTPPRSSLLSPSASWSGRRTHSAEERIVWLVDCEGDSKDRSQVESKPSISPVIAGCRRCSRNHCADAESDPVIFASTGTAESHSASPCAALVFTASGRSHDPPAGNRPAG
jgi:hypothetical protein